MISELIKFRVSVRKLSLRYKRHIIGLGLCAVFAIAGAALDSGDIQDKVNLNNDWKVPAETPPILASNLETMLAEPLFGGEPIIPEPPKKVEPLDAPIFEDWHLVGIVTEGERFQIAIMNDTSGKLELVVVGNVLPGGEKLLAISSNEIEIQHENEIKKISLFRDIER